MNTRLSRAMTALAFGLTTLGAVGCDGRAGAALQLEATADGSGNVLVQLKNGAKHEVSASTEFAYAGRGGGNLVAFLVNERGQSFPACAFIDNMSWRDEESPLPAGSSRLAWSGSKQLLQQWHCLDPGNYSAIFAYVRRGGDLVVSRPIRITIAANTRN